MPSLYGGWERLQEDGEVRLNSPIELMRFTLVYSGPLPAQSDGRLREKQHIRRSLHKQLRELWLTKPTLRIWFREWHEARPEDRQAIENRYDHGHNASLIQTFPRLDFRFAPLVQKRQHLWCELDILFLRAEPPGGLFSQADHSVPNLKGDLDNRIKVLFDAMCMPEHENQLDPSDKPQENEVPFFCLLEDDKLITVIRLESERLLDVGKTDWDGDGGPITENHVRLVIRVTLKTHKLTTANIEIAGD